MTVSLRPHHLLCLLTYVGKGYTPAFVDNYDALARRLRTGESITIVNGPDDVCAPIVDAVGSHCRNASVFERDRRAIREVGLVLGRTLAYGDDLDLDTATLQRLRASFASGQSRGACTGCEWSALCTSVASRHFEGARVSVIKQVRPQF